MRYGDTSWLEEQWKERGSDPYRIPTALKNKPILIPYLSFYYSSFVDLSTCRGDGYIPWTAIDSYCRRFGIKAPHEFDTFCKIIRTMDNKYVEYTHAERERAAAANTK